ncbi:hypothetical protein EGW08_015156 [Elysia chlorotica]|uniref:Uncharacterized protein n=1 Tax=Elysia chlorotica TaxID=188477 RepID=A0A3S1B679_ELYCH|nr:hypothetical protein EGW08_015156 [Elysia chlorotica]
MRSNKVIENNLKLLGDNDDNAVYNQDSHKRTAHFSSDDGVEGNTPELDGNGREEEDFDLPEKPASLMQKNQPNRRKHLQNFKPQNKINYNFYQSPQKKNEKSKTKKLKNLKMDAGPLRALPVPDFNAERFRSSPGCIFLDVAAQERLGLFLSQCTPYRSYARKNIGYLFAIAHGAKVIYETDDDNRPLDLLKSFQLGPTMSGLMFAGDDLFNPYHHFGQSTLWPRGYPLGAIGSALTQHYRLSSKWTTPAIQQGVVNGDPDMDAIFRLTRKQTTSRLEVSFDPAAPPAILPEGVYSPFNSQNTLFRYEALWAMLLPTTTTFRMCDIWRGYWAQRLLWEIGSRLAFFPPNAYQQRNAHSYLEDAEDERDMYFETDRLLNFLSNWSCPPDHTFFQCVYLLSVAMAENNFWKAGDAKVTQLWLEDLIRVGYREPKRSYNYRSSDTTRHKGMANHGIEHESGKYSKGSKQNNSGKTELATKRLLTLRNGTFVYFAASQQSPPSVYTKNSVSLSRASHKAKDIASMCPQLTNISVTADAIRHKQATFFDDILLVVVFNWPHYSNVKYLETIYRNVFPNIAYCGGNSEMFLAETKGLDIDLTFINAPVLIGVYGYTCFIAAAQMGYNVTGYMVVGDDVLVNMWNFHGFDKDRIWSNFAVHIFNVNNGTNWSWWGFQVGERAYNKSMAAIRRQQQWENNRDNQQEDYFQNGKNDSRRLQNFDSSDIVKPATAFLSTLFENTGGSSYCPHAVSDVYYIPARLAPSAAHYMSLFARQGLMVELAISMTIYGLSLRDDIQFFSGDNLWLGERLDPWHKFNPLSFFLHPVKFSNTSNLQPLCSKYLTTLLKNVYKVEAEAVQPINASLADRKAYISRLQKSYRERQDLQKTWLQQELLAMKRRKEENIDRLEHKKDVVSEHKQNVHAHQKQQGNRLQQAPLPELENKDRSDDRDSLQPKREEHKQIGPHRKEQPVEENQPRIQKTENEPKETDISNGQNHNKHDDPEQPHKENPNRHLNDQDPNDPDLDDNLFQEAQDEKRNNREHSQRGKARQTQHGKRHARSKTIVKHNVRDEY